MSSPNLPKLPTLIRRLHIENDIFGKKRVPYRKLAVRYSVSRRTITDDVKWIKTTLNLSHMQKSVSDKVLKALEDEKESKIILQYGLPFLAKAIPQQIETKEERIEKHEINVNVYNDDEKSILDKAARLLDRKSKDQSTSIH